MWLIPIAVLVLFLLGIIEKKKHQENVNAIPVRININGIRGKSTVTRLVTGILVEAGYKTVGKTTGTDARLIYWDTEEEKPIIRKPQGPNINEQKDVVKEAADRGAEALVSECMAVNPDYQITFQDEWMQGNIGVIVNVLEDHMDVMGPTLDEVAEAFTATIPHNGYLIVSDDNYVEYFTRKAQERNTKVIVADTSRISESFLREFDYMVFPENAALALAVAQALGIDEETAKRGMLNARPDPGALRIIPLFDQKEPSYFVNGFAANDARSTLNIWKRVTDLGYPAEDPIVIMNCREDRVDRTEQFAESVLPHIESGMLILIGESTWPVVDAYQKGMIPSRRLLNLEGAKAEEIVEKLPKNMGSRVIYGVGNIHGAAEPFIEALKEYQLKELVS